MSQRAPTTSPELIISIEQFTQLIRSAMRQGHFNCAELSRRTGITTSKLSRGLNGKAEFDLPTIHDICRCIGIDSQRALLAIGYLGDWRRYYDPDIAVVSDLIRALPATLAAARNGCDRVAIGDHGIKIIADKVSAMIADNDRKVNDRRNSFGTEEHLRPTS